MTHDELLAEIDSEQFRNSRTLATPYAALRAVVELHKPVDIEFPDVTFCEDCGESGFYVWPCRTIQAIEKELK